MSFNFSDIFGFSKFVNTRFVDEFIAEESLIEIPVVPSGGFKSLLSGLSSGESLPPAMAPPPAGLPPGESAPPKMAPPPAGLPPGEGAPPATPEKKGLIKFEESGYGPGGI
jgi:hypothetical protein